MAPYGAFKQLFGSPNGIQANELCKGPRFYATAIDASNAYSWICLLYTSYRELRQRSSSRRAPKVRRCAVLVSALAAPASRARPGRE